MSDEELRPRRAWQADDAVDATDDTAAADEYMARRGGTDEADAPVNPFARPGSDEAAQPLPAADELGDTPIPAPVFPRSAGEYADSPSPAPRRSALSSTTPVEQPAAEAAPTQDWLAAHSRRLATWAVVGVVGAIALGLIAYLVSRGMGTAGPTESPAPSPSASSASPTPTREPAEATDLLVAGDLATLAPAARWSVIETSHTLADHKQRAACLSTDSAVANPTHSLQRALATTDADGLAALHRIDVYAAPSAAMDVFDGLVTTLSQCSEIPAHIVRSTTVAGLAEETFQVTIAFENETTQFHTVLLSRIGAAVQLLDVARNGEPADPDAAAEALVRPAGLLCTEQGVDCTIAPTVTDAVVPPAEPSGWLIPSDLPRITPAAGRWSMSTPGDVTSRGMGCENMTLATEPGPTSRQQSTYLMTEDEAPATFGMDEMIFTFGDQGEADAFTDRLANSIASCKNRSNTATVTELKPVSAKGAGDVSVSSRMFNVTQATGNAPLHFQLLVSKAGTKVSYTLVTVTDKYKFSDAQLNGLGIRIPTRMSQLA